MATVEVEQAWLTHRPGTRRPRHRRGPGPAVKALKLMNGEAQVKVVEDLGVHVFFRQPALGGFRRQNDGMLIGHAALPAGEG